MKADYWNVSNEQLIEKTGKGTADWIRSSTNSKPPKRNQMM